MSERVGFFVHDASLNPVTGAVPTFLVYKSKVGGALTPPAISHIAGGVYGFTATDADVAAGAAYLISTGFSPPYVFGSVHSESAPFATFLFTDVVGTLWTGAAPSVGVCSDFLGAARLPQPTLLAQAGSHLYSFVPTFQDVQGGTAYRVDGPAGAAQVRYFGSFSLPLGLFGSSLGALVYSALAGDGAVAALVGTRIFPNVRPPAVQPPLLVYNVVSQGVENALNESAQTRLKHYRLQLDAYAKTYEAAHQLATAAENVVANLSSPDLVGWKDTERDLYDDEARFHRVSCDYLVSTG